MIRLEVAAPCYVFLVLLSLGVLGISVALLPNLGTGLIARWTVLVPFSLSIITAFVAIVCILKINISHTTKWVACVVTLSMIFASLTVASGVFLLHAAKSLQQLAAADAATGGLPLKHHMLLQMSDFSLGVYSDCCRHTEVPRCPGAITDVNGKSVYCYLDDRSFNEGAAAVLNEDKEDGFNPCNQFGLGLKTDDDFCPSKDGEPPNIKGFMKHNRNTFSPLCAMGGIAFCSLGGAMFLFAGILVLVASNYCCSNEASVPEFTAFDFKYGTPLEEPATNDAKTLQIQQA